MITQQERDRAHRLGTLAARADRGLGGACPYDANGTPDEKTQALIFVRSYVDAGGQVDGLDYAADDPDTIVRGGKHYRAAGA